MRVLILALTAFVGCAPPDAGGDAGSRGDASIDTPDAGVELGDSGDAGPRPDCGTAILAAGLVCEQLGGVLLAPRDVWVTRGGDIVVTEMGAGRIVRLSGDHWVTVASGLAGPIGIRELADGDLVVAEENARSVSRFHPVTGARVVIAESLRSVTYLALGASDAIFTSSFDPGVSGGGIVWRIDPSSGARFAFATGLEVPEGLFVEGDGSLVVAEWALPSSVRRFAAGGGSLSGSAEVAGGFAHVYGLIEDGAGGIFVGDHAGRVVRIRRGGAREVLLDGIGRPGGLARQTDGALLVAEFVDFGAEGRLLRITGLD